MGQINILFSSKLYLQSKHRNKRWLTFSGFQVLERRCAWFNPDLGDFGVFDTDGCYIVETKAEYTKCACDKFGIFGVLSEKVAPAVSDNL